MPKNRTWRRYKGLSMMGMRVISRKKYINDSSNNHQNSYSLSSKL
jgi:hypothetical protein